VLLSPRLGMICAFGLQPLILAGAARSSDLPRFELPINCRIGTSCVIQNYVDVDPSRGARDYASGTLTYDGHDGTDFRLIDAGTQRTGVNVLAAGAGRVSRTRDGVSDVSVRDVGRESTKGRECGNGVVIDHPDGWQTQYCHLKRGTVSVGVGDQVGAGQPVGQVGLSGLTEFPHLHFTVRRYGKAVDPFSYGAVDGRGAAGNSLWKREVDAAMGYRPVSILNMGFAAGKVTLESIETGAVEQMAPSSNSEEVLVFALAIGLRAGDVPRIIIEGPDGAPFVDHSARPMERDKAQYFMFAGKRRPDAGWPKGRYHATYRVLRGKETVVERSADLIL
jgi:hypothetical protein